MCTCAHVYIRDQINTRECNVHTYIHSHTHTHARSAEKKSLHVSKRIHVWRERQHKHTCARVLLRTEVKNSSMRRNHVHMCPRRCVPRAYAHGDLMITNRHSRAIETKGLHRPSPNSNPYKCTHAATVVATRQRRSLRTRRVSRDQHVGGHCTQHARQTLTLQHRQPRPGLHACVPRVGMLEAALVPLQGAAQRGRRHVLRLS